LHQRRKNHKLLVLITADPKSAIAIRRARRISDFLGADCFAVTVQAADDLSGLPQSERSAIEQHLNFARNLHIETRVLEGTNAAEAVVDFARRNGVTQIFVTRPQPTRWGLFSSRETVQGIIAQAKDMQIVIVSDREAGVRK
jgi:two-component system sensor histidine kinase KdpD